ncbi:DUF1120 domain-containing protein, partial [Stenotrophomonas rhizophila]|uniref:DUF1120 domain-containing protein n=1 Tax=Stenotrophomonas rhizophila TaxID=216778 RepID=UPI001E3AFE42
AVALLGMAGGATAATTADLSVVGTIKSPACGVVLDGGGIVDFGNISRTLLKPAESAAIGAKDIAATVTCTDDTLVLLKVVDNKEADKPTGNMTVKFEGSSVPGTDGSHAPANLLGLGQSHAGTPIGAYALAFGPPDVDGITATYIYANNDGAISYDNYSTTALHFRGNTNVYFGANTGGGANLNMPGKVHKFPMAVAVSLDKSGNIPGDADVSLDGSATLEVVYL